MQLQDGSSPYLAKSDAAPNSGSTLRMGVSSSLKPSGASTALEIPGAKVATAALQGAPMGTAPAAGAIPRGVPPPVRRGPADLPAFVKSAPGTPPPPGAVRVSAPPVPTQGPSGRVDPATYLSPGAAVAVQTSLPPETPSAPAVTSFPLTDMSDEEDEPLPVRKTNGASPVLTALGLFAAAAEAVSPLWKVRTLACSADCATFASSYGPAHCYSALKGEDSGCKPLNLSVCCFRTPPDLLDYVRG